MNVMPGRIMWFAIAVGLLADNVISLIITAISQQYDPELGQQITFATGAGALVAVLLVASTGFGGWLAGRLAKTEHVLHGALVGGMGIIILLFTSLFGAEPIPLINTLLQCVAVVVGAFGGWLSQWIPKQPQQ